MYAGLLYRHLYIKRLFICDVCRHVRSTIASSALKLTAQDISEIESVLVKATGPSGSIYELEREVSGPHGRIMKYNLNQINQGSHLEELCHRLEISHLALQNDLADVISIHELLTNQILLFNPETIATPQLQYDTGTVF